MHPPWNPWNIQLSQGTGQGVSMTFNAASRLRSLEDRSAALGSSRCELPGMHSVPKSAVLPYASGVGGLSRRLLNNLQQFWTASTYVWQCKTLNENNLPGRTPAWHVRLASARFLHIDQTNNGHHKRPAKTYRQCISTWHYHGFSSLCCAPNGRKEPWSYAPATRPVQIENCRNGSI